MDKNLKFNRVQFIVILILIIVGIVLCLDLGYIFYKANFLENAAKSFCSVSELIDCDGVAATEYSVSFGIPNAIWGLFVYSLLLFLLFVDRIQAKFKDTIFDVFKNPSSYIASISLLMFLLSMILASISIFIIHKICALCFCTYILDLLIAFSAKGKGFFVEDIKNTAIDFVDGVKKYFLLFLIVLIAFISGLVYLDTTMIASPKIKEHRQFKEFYGAKTNKYAISGNILGKTNSKVIINVYSDFNCPFCKVINIMMHKLAKNEDVIINEINYPLDTTCNKRIGHTLGGHENSCLYSRYALAAEKQEKYWGVANILFYQTPANEDELLEIVSKAKFKIDIEKLKQDANSKEIADRLDNDINKTADRGIMGTPSFEINDTLYAGAIPYDSLVEKVQLAKKRAENN